MKRIFYFFCVLSLLVSCQTSMIDANKVDRIVFYPTPKGVKYTIYFNSFPDILKINGRDTVILDRADIKEFCNLLNSLEYEDEDMYYDYNSYTYPDFRCGVILKMKSGAEWCYCFGESKWIFYNGCKFMKNYQPIFDYIDKNIYGTKPNYYWYGNRQQAVSEFIDR